LQASVHNEHAWSWRQPWRQSSQPLPAGGRESLSTPIVDGSELGCPLIGMLVNRSGPKDIAVTVTPHARNVARRQQGNAFVGLGTKVDHIPRTDNEIHAFASEPVEAGLQPVQATVGVADNSDSHGRKPLAGIAASLVPLHRKDIDSSA
jgi:hypothetical protein